LGIGASSVFENVVDLGANALATLQSLFSHNEAAKKTREWANKDVIKEGLKSDSYASPIGAFYNFSKGNGTYWDNFQRQQIQNIREKQNRGEELSSYEKSQLDILGKLHTESESSTPANYEDDSVLGDTSGVEQEVINWIYGWISCWNIYIRRSRRNTCCYWKYNS